MYVWDLDIIFLNELKLYIIRKLFLENKCIDFDENWGDITYVDKIKIGLHYAIATMYLQKNCSKC